MNASIFIVFFSALFQYCQSKGWLSNESTIGITTVLLLLALPPIILDTISWIRGPQDKLRTFVLSFLKLLLSDSHKTFLRYCAINDFGLYCNQVSIYHQFVNVERIVHPITFLNSRYMSNSEIVDIQAKDMELWFKSTEDRQTCLEYLKGKSAEANGFLQYSRMHAQTELMGEYPINILNMREYTPTEADISFFLDNGCQGCHVWIRMGELLVSLNMCDKSNVRVETGYVESTIRNDFILSMEPKNFLLYCTYMSEWQKQPNVGIWTEINKKYGRKHLVSHCITTKEIGLLCAKGIVPIRSEVHGSFYVEGGVYQSMRSNYFKDKFKKDVGDNVFQKYDEYFGNIESKFDIWELVFNGLTSIDVKKYSYSLKNWQSKRFLRDIAFMKQKMGVEDYKLYVDKKINPTKTIQDLVKFIIKEKEPQCMNDSRSMGNIEGETSEEVKSSIDDEKKEAVKAIVEVKSVVKVIDIPWASDKYEKASKYIYMSPSRDGYSESMRREKLSKAKNDLERILRMQQILKSKKAYESEVKVIGGQKLYNYVADTIRKPSKRRVRHHFDCIITKATKKKTGLFNWSVRSDVKRKIMPGVLEKFQFVNNEETKIITVTQDEYRESVNEKIKEGKYNRGYKMILNPSMDSVPKLFPPKMKQIKRKTPTRRKYSKRPTKKVRLSESYPKTVFYNKEIDKDHLELKRLEAVEEKRKADWKLRLDVSRRLNIKGEKAIFKSLSYFSLDIRMKKIAGTWKFPTLKF